MDIFVKMKDGTKREFKHKARAGGSYNIRLTYEGAFAVVTDEYDNQTAIPAADIEEIQTRADQGEPAQAVLAWIPREVDKRVNARAARSPWDYMVGTEAERTIAQEEADEIAAQNGQFGAGA